LENDEMQTQQLEADLKRLRNTEQKSARAEKRQKTWRDFRHQMGRQVREEFA
jgi:ribosomal protein S13